MSRRSSPRPSSGTIRRNTASSRHHEKDIHAEISSFRPSTRRPRHHRLPRGLEPNRLAREVLDLEGVAGRSEEHTSELQSQSNLVCRLLLEKKKRSSPRPPYQQLPSVRRGGI